MTRKVLVRDIMTHEVICANLNNKLSQVLEFFAKFKMRHLPVLDGDSIVGIISVNDIINFLNDHLQKSETITQTYLDEYFSLDSVMTKNPITIGSTDSIDDAVKLLAPGDFQSIIVADAGAIKGIITNKDLVRFHNSGFNTDHDNFTISTSGFGI
jgi:CBS domain-containing membrane protein